MGVTQKSLAKLSPPRIPATTARSRLVERLDTMTELPGVWIEGPAGSGKTTLVADYLKQTDRPQFWYHVDEGDRDPSALVSYLIQLAEQASPETPTLPFLTPEHLADLEGFARQLVRGFYQSLPADAVVVIDNCHRAAVDPFHMILRVALEEVPPGIWLIALSRHQMPPEFVKLRANRGIGLLGAEELALDAAETRLIVAEHMPRSNVSAEVLHRACGGWVAGLILLLNQHERMTGASALDMSSREALFQYFAGEIYDAAAPQMQHLLLSTALLPVISVEVAREMSGDDKAGMLLDDLYRRHYFTSRRAGDPPVYTYHDLFRAFLGERLAQELPAGALRALRAASAAQLERLGYFSEALEQYSLLDDSTSIVRIVRGQAQYLVDEGRLQTLSNWLERLPAGVVRDDPWLIFYQGVSISLSQPAEAKIAFERAYELFALRGDAAGQFNAAFAVMEVMLVISTTFHPWDRWIAALEPLLEAHLPEDPAMGVRAWYAFLYTCLYRKPGHRLIGRAVEYLEHQLFKGDLRSTHAIQAATGLLAYAHFACEQELASRVMPVLRAVLESEHLAVFSRTWGTVWIGVYNYFDAHYEDALKWSTAARDLADRHEIVTVRQIMGCYRIQSLVRLGRVREALNEAATLRTEILHDNLYPNAYLTSVTGLAHFAAGNQAQALECGERCSELWRENGFLIAEAGWVAVHAMYLLHDRCVEEASTLVEQAASLLEGSVCNYVDPLVEVLRAECAHQRGDLPETLERLRSALAMCVNRKRAVTLSWARSLLPSLLSLAFSKDIEAHTVGALIHEWGLEPPDMTTLNWLWPAEIRTFGGFELLVAGQPHKGSRKTQRRLLELIKYLAVAGQGGATVDNLVEALWPDAEGDVAHGNFRTALFRARKLLGSDSAIWAQSGRVGLNPKRVWVDTIVLEAALRSGACDHVITSIYRGELLPGEDAFWLLAARRKWQESLRFRSSVANQ